MKLRPYQEKLIEQVRQKMVSGCKSVLLQSATGSGKTILTAKMLKSAAGKGKRCWFLCHRREIIKQSVRTFVEAKVRHGVIAAGFGEDTSQNIQIASVQTLARRYHNVIPPDLIIYDECFPSGTMIDHKPIEKIKIGETVHCFDEETKAIKISKVCRIFKNKAPNILVKLRINEKNITCTLGHPFFTTKGWKKAAELTAGDTIYGLYNMRRTNQSKQNCEMPKLLSKNNDSEEHQGFTSENERKKPNVFGGIKKKGVRNIKKNWASTKNKRWKWQAHLCTTAETFKCSWRKIRTRICCCDKYFQRIWPPNALQDRYRRAINKISHRGGWPFSLFNKKKRTGCKKRKVLGFARLDSIEIFQSSSESELRKLCPDGFVYNIEVEKYHTYFVNNIAVHNCHHVAAGTWDKIYKAFPKAFHIGLTATPERLDGKGLKPWFDDIVYGPPVRWLIDEGYLVDYKVFAPGSVDTSDMKISGGDFNKKALHEAIKQKPQIVGDAIREYKKHALGSSTVVFNVSVENSENLVSQFNSAGIKAAHVDGKTGRDLRDLEINRFKNGDINILSNVDLFGEGFDVPGITGISMMRPTNSLGLYLQQVGRALRPVYAEGFDLNITNGRLEAIANSHKPYAIILDHAGNVARHGLPDQERQWSLLGKKHRISMESDGPGVKICKSCFAAQKAGPPKCKHCGFVFEVKGREYEHIDGELKELDLATLKKQQIVKRKVEQSKAHKLEDLYDLGVQRGMKNPRGWAKYVFNARQRKKLGR